MNRRATQDLAVWIVAGLAVLATAPSMTSLGPIAPQADALHVMTYNVHQWYDGLEGSQHNFEQVRQVIAAARVDVVALQESEGGRLTSGKVDGVRWLGEQLGMDVYTGPPLGHQVYGVSILSRHPIVGTGWIELPSRESIERVLVVVTLDTPWGQVRVASTHFQTPPFAADRASQASATVQALAGAGRAIIMGDFNTEPDPQDAAYARLSDAWGDAWAISGQGDGFTSPAHAPTARIDHIWLQGTWDVSDLRVAGSAAASDHLGVRASVRPL